MMIVEKIIKLSNALRDELELFSFQEYICSESSFDVFELILGKIADFDIEIYKKKCGLHEKPKPERILSDAQLMELRDDIRDGVSMTVSVEYQKKFEVAIRELLKYLPRNPEDEYTLVPENVIDEVRRLLGPEPKEPPRMLLDMMCAEEIKEVAEEKVSEKDGTERHLYILIGNLANLIKGGR